MDVEAYYIVADGAIADIVTFVPFSQVYKSLTISKVCQYDCNLCMSKNTYKR